MDIGMENQKESIKKIHILLITGKIAYGDLENIDWGDLNKRYKFSIFKASTPIAAFITKKELENILRDFNSKRIYFDFIIVSGLIQWDVGKIDSPLAGKIKKGPKFLVNLKEVLKKVDLSNLSAKNAAEDVITRDVKKEFEEILDKQKNIAKQKNNPDSFYLSEKFPNYIFSSNLVPILIGEIVDIPKLSLQDIFQKIDHYIESGADIIDLGCIANEDYSEKISPLIKKLIKKYNIPFSIDSLNPIEIINAVKAGASIVLSVSMNNYKELLKLPRNIVLVIVPVIDPIIVPETSDSNWILEDPKKTVARLWNLYKILSDEGFNKILIDPITRTPINPGITKSFEILRLLKQKIEEIKIKPEELKQGKKKPQLFMGFGNVTELIDGDSPGINTMLALISSEFDVTGILSTECSSKSRHVLRELHDSLTLAYFSKQKNQPPINLGIDAFRLKFKDSYPKYISYSEKNEFIRDNKIKAVMDPKGYFKIYIDEKKHQIIVTHFKNSLTEQIATKSFIGTCAESIYKKIIQENLVSRMDHAAYLGKELMRAELAKKFGIKYIQN